MNFHLLNLDRDFPHLWTMQKRIRRHFKFELYNQIHQIYVQDMDLILRENDEQLKNGQIIVGSVTSADAITDHDSRKADATNLTPLVTALKASAKENSASFHFPGHNRGLAAPPSLTQLIGEKTFLHDLPALPELDNFFAPAGVILEAKKMAAQLFGAAETWFLVGGTTCGIQAAIMATCSPGDVLILPRNSHISAFSGMVFSGAVPKYIIPQYNSNWDICGGITPSQVDRAIKELETEDRKAAAVFIVSPTYHGICSDVAAISQLCHSHNIPLIVDEAHGAHFGFHQQLPNSALSQGADISVQSTHKVLSSLTQSSMLHMSAGNLIDRYRICKCLQMLQSTSPSYLLLSSLDAARAQLSENRGSIFNRAIGLAGEARTLMSKISKISVLNITDFFNFLEIDPLRITIGTKKLGISGFEADRILSKEFGVIAELVGTQSIMLAFNLGTQREHVLRLTSGLKHLSTVSTATEKVKDRKGIRNWNGLENLAPFENVKVSLNPREAFFASKTKVAIEDSVGGICGEIVCPYPPGVPLLIPGEIITEGALNYLLELKAKGVVITGVSDPLLGFLLVCKP